MTQVENKHRVRWSIDETQAEVARARLSFDRELQQATLVGARAARRFFVPALWGLALLGGGMALLAISRLARRKPGEALLVRVVVEPRWSTNALLPALGVALARAAARRWSHSQASFAAQLGAPDGDPQLGGRQHGEAPSGLARRDSRGAQYDSTANGQLENIG